MLHVLNLHKKIYPTFPHNNPPIVWKDTSFFYIGQVKKTIYLKKTQINLG